MGHVFSPTHGKNTDGTMVGVGNMVESGFILIQTHMVTQDLSANSNGGMIPVVIG